MEMNCGKDPIDALKQMFANRSINAGIKAGKYPVWRTTFLKTADFTTQNVYVFPVNNEPIQSKNLNQSHHNYLTHSL